jgi:ribonuclease HI
VISVYADASFRSTRRDASGLAVIIVNAGKITGRAAMTATATSSHHAECMAALLGLRMALTTIAGQQPTLVALHTDDKEIVNKLKLDRRPRNTVLVPVLADLKGTIRSITDQGSRVDVRHSSRSSDHFMSHVDWMSKSIAAPEEK